jgi:hypothetical protein
MFDEYNEIFDRCTCMLKLYGYSEILPKKVGSSCNKATPKIVLAVERE